MNRIFTALMLGWLGVSGFAKGDEWPQFRGPDRSGAMKVGKLEKGKTFGLEIQWRQALGAGYSSISTKDQTGVTMYTDGTSDILLAFDTATGTRRWEYRFGDMYKGHSGSHDGPSGTPTLSDGHVYALGRYGRLVAFSIDDGKKLWERHLGQDVKARVPHYGFNTTPTVVGPVLIVMTGAEDGASFTAFDRHTGTTLWQAGNDTGTYQSPNVWNRGGKTLVLGVTDHHLMALNPTDGSIYWQQPHGFSDNEEYAMPVVLGENRILLLNRYETAAFDLAWQGDVATMENAWRGNQFHRTYTIPVFHEGYLYGFKGQFLTCINAKNGEVMWRSRPPGGQGLTLLGDHLFILGKKGNLVAIEANSEAYQEKARIKLFEKGSYTPISFAKGQIFARNQTEIASIKIINEETRLALERAKPPELKGEFGEFVSRVEQATDKTALIDAFMKEQTRFPIIEGDSLVHFVFRGPVKDISLHRSFDRERLLSRIEGTDFFFHSQELDPAGHWDYQFRVFGEPILDPNNPHMFVENEKPFNELRMPRWPEPNHLHEPTRARGTLETLVLDSQFRGEQKTVQVYLPVGYAESKDRYPLMVVINGRLALEAGKMDWSLDNLIGTKVSPVVVAFVDGNVREFFASDLTTYSQFITKELVPKLDETYRTRSNKTSRGIMGLGFGASAATYTAFENPGVFGKLASQSFAYPFKKKDALKAMIEGAPNDMEIYLETSSVDYDAPHYKAVEDSPDLLAFLKEKGFSIKEVATAGAPGFGSWRSRTDVIFAWFAPMNEAMGM